MRADSNKACAHAYYEAMQAKDISEMKQYLHANVELTSPLAHLTGRDAVLDAVSKLFPLFHTLEIRATFGSNAGAMVVYDFNFMGPLGIVRTAALLTINDDLITRIELFFDARPFDSSRRT